MATEWRSGIERFKICSKSNFVLIKQVSFTISIEHADHADSVLYLISKVGRVLF